MSGTAAPASAILAEVAQIRALLDFIAEKYPDAEHFAWSSGGPGAAKVRVVGADPTGELATATVQIDHATRELLEEQQTASATEVAAHRADVVRASQAVHAMARSALKAVAALNRATKPSSVQLAKDGKAPATPKVRRWTSEELEVAERHARERVEREGRLVRR